MLCPNCGQQMNVRNVDNEIVLHCSTCGSSFFDKNGINKITQNSARILTEEAQGQYVLGNQKVCPKDKSILLEKIDATLPKNTILLECPSCEGIFAYPDDLLKYKGIKGAQPLASGAFKLLPAPKSLFMLASFAVLSIAVLLNTGSFSSDTRAEKVIGKVYLNTAGSLLSVSFKSQVSETSTIIFYDEKRVETGRYIVSSEPKTVHVGTIRGFDKNRDVFYAIQFSKTSTPITEVQLEK
ncbi:MAG: zf-TFIIB domain-containing protein [Candidatus Roizmanbacteria bacterium]|nr:zf-TFIIB domain-containing protein [Candidatus Roizmanbacteria bacterium]